MPHIPEAELHAYLDQALSRLRCVEIESHLAECTPCRAARDEIAALRDRTTAMLARLAPRRTVAPPIMEIRRRAAVRIFRRERLRQRIAWAASVVIAVGIGWAGARYLAPLSGRTAVGPSPAAPAPQQLPARSQPVSPVVPRISEAEASPPRVPAQPETAPRPTMPERPAAQERNAPGALAATDEDRRKAPSEADPAPRSAAGEHVEHGVAPARTEGTSLADGAAQPADSGRKPAMVVAQQLRSGEVVRAVQGPVADVSTLFTARPGDTAGSTADPSGSRTPAPGAAFSFRQGDRVFNNVPGNLPSDSLRAMMRRLNLMSRVR